MTMSERATPKAWSDWYRFARDEFDFGHEECVEYANLRFVEEQNRASLRARRESAEAAATPARPAAPPE
jgi:hypothetical protein